MTEKNNGQLVLKPKVPLNFSSRPQEKIEKFSKWYHAQSNAQNSFLSMVEHMIDRFGYVDICDHEIAKKLHTEILHFVGTSEIEEQMKNDSPIVVEEKAAPVKTETLSQPESTPQNSKTGLNLNSF